MSDCCFRYREENIYFLFGVFVFYDFVTVLNRSRFIRIARRHARFHTNGFQKRFLIPKNDFQSFSRRLIVS